MPNIYLRLPQYVCDYYRGRDEIPLEHHEPVKFMDFTMEAHVLREGANINVSISEQHDSHCYSQQSWHNICDGYKADRKMRVINRDRNVWPSMQELCTIEGEYISKRTASFDYLCIALPSSVLMRNRMVRTNAGWTLDKHSAAWMIRLLRDEFCFTILDWLVQDRRYCNCNPNGVVIRRSRMASLERFCVEYNIDTTMQDMDSLRRMVNRWLHKAHFLRNDRINFDAIYKNFFKHLSDDELERKENAIEWISKETKDNDESYQNKIVNQSENKT